MAVEPVRGVDKNLANKIRRRLELLAVDLWEASHSPNAEKIIQIKPIRSEFSA